MVKPSDFVFDASEIIAHMFFSAGTTDAVRVTHNAGEFSGTFRYPISDAVDIVCSTEDVVLKPGEPVYVSYSGAGDQYRFHSEVVSTNGEVIRVCFPVAIERSDRRLTVRVPIPEGMRVEFAMQGHGGPRPCRVRDLSDGGLSFLCEQQQELAAGEVVYGTLAMPGERPLRFGLEVRHQNARGEERIVGGRMVGISLQERGRLSRFIVEKLILNPESARA